MSDKTQLNWFVKKLDNLKSQVLSRLEKLDAKKPVKAEQTEELPPQTETQQ